MALLSELSVARTRDEVMSLLLSALQGKGFPVTDWYPGGVARTLLEAIAMAIADEVSVMVPRVVRSGLLAYAEGEDLDLLAQNVYGVTRYPAQFAEGTVILTAAPDMGPYTVQAGSFWVGTPDGLRFVATENATVPKGGSVSIRVRAESPGSAWNVAAGAITVVHTPYPGLSVTNPSGWLITAGRDAETDEELRQRCRSLWPTVAYARPAEAYVAWAKEASPAVLKAAVLVQPRGQGTVDVVVWGDGSIGSADVAAVDAYLQERKDLVADLKVYAATPRTISITGTVYVRPGTLSTAQSQVNAALKSLERSIPIGGWVYDDAIIAAIRSSSDVVDVDLTAPVGDTQLAVTEAAVLSQNLTWVGV
ncbi:baseplate J/gp47 family protein [Thermus sp. PS18]|uniref:baseplate J/gp47 family protein n=1 Tax=Thermus sp. PS18 TaxID=2849039 RepID=UPI002264FE95|nr:baseplate J/gp47 family protein [Thermus sp. PS18]UZX16567.1 baseplate J/gp47 family protein [Thermus sp. PS18]